MKLIPEFELNVRVTMEDIQLGKCGTSDCVLASAIKKLFKRNKNLKVSVGFRFVSLFDSSREWLCKLPNEVTLKIVDHVHNKNILPFDCKLKFKQKISS